MTPFQQAFKFSFEHETSSANPTGYVNDPTDPGGETKYGISKRAYPTLDIKNLTLADAMAIYERDYWRHYGLDTKPFPICIALYDSYIQHPPNKVSAWYEKSGDDVRAFLELRREFYLAIIQAKPVMVKYKNGWLNRVNDLSKYLEIVGTHPA